MFSETLSVKTLSTDIPFFFLFPHEKSEIILIFVLLYVLWFISLAALKYSLYHCFPVVWFLCLSCLMFISFLDFHHFEKKIVVILLHTVLTHYFFPLYSNDMYVWPLDVALQIAEAFYILLVLFLSACVPQFRCFLLLELEIHWYILQCKVQV